MNQPFPGTVWSQLFSFPSGAFGPKYTSTEVSGLTATPLGRESFSPDASFFDGPLPANLMRFVEGPPTFAVEVRSENSYDATAEAAIEGKQAEYFAAGTLVVWDVDPIAETITCYRHTAPTQPVVWRRGDTADAEACGAWMAYRGR